MKLTIIQVMAKIDGAELNADEIGQLTGTIQLELATSDQQSDLTFGVTGALNIRAL